MFSTEKWNNVKTKDFEPRFFLLKFFVCKLRKIRFITIYLIYLSTNHEHVLLSLHMIAVRKDFLIKCLMKFGSF